MAYRFNPPPGWPQPPEGWRPPEGWQPDPSWPAAPQGWEYWVDDAAEQSGAAAPGVTPPSAAPTAGGATPTAQDEGGLPPAEAPAAPGADAPAGTEPGVSQGSSQRPGAAEPTSEGAPAAEAAEIDDAPTIFVRKAPPTPAPEPASAPEESAGSESTGVTEASSAPEAAGVPPVAVSSAAAEPGADQPADSGKHRATDTASDAPAAGDDGQAPVPDQPAPQHPAEDATQQFQTNMPTRQMPQWGGIPQQPAPGQFGAASAPQDGAGQPGQPPAPGHDPAAGAPPFAGQGPAGTPEPAPQQPQWGTGPAVGSGQFGAASAPPYAGGYQQASPHQPPPPPGAGPSGPSASMPPHSGSYSAAPPPGSGPQFGGPAGSQPYPQSGPFTSGNAPATKNRTPLIVGGIVIVIVLALLVVLAVRLIGGDGATESSPTPTVTAPSTDPTDDSTTPPPTDDPSDQQTTGSGGGGDLAALGPGEPAVVTGTSGEPEVEVALVSLERGWQPEGSQSAICPDPAGEYIALEFEFTTLPALADGTGSYSFAGFEVGLANDNGTTLDASGVSGLFCLGSDQRAPSEVGPGETFTGWAVVDAPAEASQVLWEPWLDFTGAQPTYAWTITDF